MTNLKSGTPLLTANDIVKIIKAMKESCISELSYNGLELKAEKKDEEKNAEPLTSTVISPNNQLLLEPESHISTSEHRPTGDIDLGYLKEEYLAIDDPLKFENSLRLSNSEA